LGAIYILHPTALRAQPLIYLHHSSQTKTTTNGESCKANRKKVTLYRLLKKQKRLIMVAVLCALPVNKAAEHLYKKQHKSLIGA
jgi:hypothetical protein